MSHDFDIMGNEIEPSHVNHVSWQVDPVVKTAPFKLVYVPTMMYQALHYWNMVDLGL